MSQTFTGNPTDATVNPFTKKLPKRAPRPANCPPGTSRFVEHMDDDFEPRRDSAVAADRSVPTFSDDANDHDCLGSVWGFVKSLCTSGKSTTAQPSTELTPILVDRQPTRQPAMVMPVVPVAVVTRVDLFGRECDDDLYHHHGGEADAYYGIDRSGPQTYGTQLADEQQGPAPRGRAPSLFSIEIVNLAPTHDVPCVRALPADRRMALSICSSDDRETANIDAFVVGEYSDSEDEADTPITVGLPGLTRTQRRGSLFSRWFDDSSSDDNSTSTPTAVVFAPRRASFLSSDSDEEPLIKRRRGDTVGVVYSREIVGIVWPSTPPESSSSASSSVSHEDEEVPQAIYGQRRTSFLSVSSTDSLPSPLAKQRPQLTIDTSVAYQPAVHSYAHSPLHSSALTSLQSSGETIPLDGVAWVASPRWTPDPDYTPIDLSPIDQSLFADFDGDFTDAVAAAAQAWNSPAESVGLSSRSLESFMRIYHE
jgi:hypothetical protein